MGQSLHDRIARSTPISFTSGFAAHVPKPALEIQSIDAQLVTSVAAGQRLLDSIGEGVQDYIMASADGQVSVRVRLAINPSGRGRQAFGNGKLTVDWSCGAIEHGNDRVSLTQTELRLLGGLLQANGSVVSRAALIASAWPRSDIPMRENSLAVYVCGLRKRLASIGLPDALQTARRAGYRLRLD